MTPTKINVDFPVAKKVCDLVDPKICEHPVYIHLYQPRQEAMNACKTFKFSNVPDCVTHEEVIKFLEDLSGGEKPTVLYGDADGVIVASFTKDLGMWNCTCRTVLVGFFFG
jgi:hypothetical protein